MRPLSHVHVLYHSLAVIYRHFPRGELRLRKGFKGIDTMRGYMLCQIDAVSYVHVRAFTTQYGVAWAASPMRIPSYFASRWASIGSGMRVRISQCKTPSPRTASAPKIILNGSLRSFFSFSIMFNVYMQPFGYDRPNCLFPALAPWIRPVL